jgi:cytochrome c553
MPIAIGNPVYRQPSSGRDMRRPLWVTCGVLLITIGSSSHADETDLALQLRAEKVAITVCGTCHGRTGTNSQPKFPVLAGQNATYLVAQLKAFHAQTRGDPDAIAYMWGMASELDEPSMAALAAYYAVQTPQPGVGGSSSLEATGKDIYLHGIPSEGVPACSTCHGTDAHGVKDFPRLAGQHAQYILKQLGSFQSNMRNVAIMHGVAQNLRLPEMQAVAAYLEAQP